MKDYRVTAETRRLMEDMISGRHPVKDAEGNEYYVRYNENTEELETRIRKSWKKYRLRDCVR